MEFLPLFLILLAGVLFSTVFRRFHLPWVIALIVSGIALGPHGFSVLEVSPILQFFGQMGLIFLMFMAGLETKLSAFKKMRTPVSELAILNGLIPLAVGFGIGQLFGFSALGSILLGIIFVSSSIAVIIPSLETNGLLHTKLGRSIVGATIIEDVASLILLSILLQTIDPVTVLPLPLFYFLVFAALIVLRYLLPKLEYVLVPHGKDSETFFEREVRVVFAILIGTVILFELLGLHPIIAAFFAGLVLSDTIQSKKTIDKFHTISYGIFIPTFFVIVGANTDISVFREGGSELLLVLAVVFGSMIAKFGSGWLGGKLIGYKNHEASIIGISTIPQLSTTLAVVYSAVELELLAPELITAMVILSMVTTFAAPLALRFVKTHRRGIVSTAKSPSFGEPNSG